VDQDLARLAAAYGVATWYENWQGVHVEVDPDVVVAVLRLFDVDAGSPATVRESLRTAPARPATSAALPPAPSAWGWMLQLYGLRSASSYGVGDLADLATFTRWAASTGAGAVLLNPLHAVSPIDPIPASPYSPSSRRFVNPLYLRVEGMAPSTGATDLVDHAETWRAKRAVLQQRWAESSEPAADLDPALRDFATYNALAERHGGDWRTWPAGLRRPDGPDVAAARAALADRVAFHAWLQRLCDEQLDEVRRAAAGMPIGIVHDLAVGIDPGGADAWMLQDVLATGARIGAPPDAFNQQGQDWGLTSWRPDRLAATGYAAYRDLLRGVFRHAGGLRVDHVAGLWRLWWVPPGASADQGTYVHYDADAMVGILVEEARAAGAVVVGEDLGTVLPTVTEGLREREILGSAVLWFTRDASGAFVPPAKWPERALASISTHDLPTAAGFLRGEHVTARAAAGVLGRDVEEELAAAEDDWRRLFELFAAEGLDASDPVFALHEVLARTPCRMVLASPYDVLGEARQPNLPGTTDQYPNWRIPLPLTLEELTADDRVHRVIGLFNSRP
jgi:4-alpha-glucanotransferase